MSQGAPAPPAVTAANCGGCRDDFYNDHNPLGVRQCWMMPKAHLVRRYRIHRDTMPGAPGAFTEVVVPDCMNGNVWYYCKQLPDFVKLEDVRGRRPCGYCGSFDCGGHEADADVMTDGSEGSRMSEYGFEPGDL